MMSATAVPIQPLARGSLVKFWLALALLVVAAGAFAWWTTSAYQLVTLPSGVRYQVLKQGNGPKMTSADVAVLRYKLRVNRPDNEVVQDSDQSGQPFVTTTTGVYPGFGEGLQQMQAGGSYLLWLPPGQHARSPVPPGAPFSAADTLIFEIQLLQIAKGMGPAFEMQRMQQMQQQMAPPGGGAEPGDDGGRGRGEN
jgi:FKBP-type peptidyl-prolyl cis-trans isomerase FkpA